MVSYEKRMEAMETCNLALSKLSRSEICRVAAMGLQVIRHHGNVEDQTIHYPCNYFTSPAHFDSKSFKAFSSKVQEIDPKVKPDQLCYEMNKTINRRNDQYHSLTTKEILEEAEEVSKALVLHPALAKHCRWSAFFVQSMRAMFAYYGVL